MTDQYTVAVSGGRNYTHKKKVYEVLDSLHAEKEITLLIQGGAEGADFCADHWAFDRQVDCLRKAAKWEKYRKYGRKNPAGPIRNEAMAALKPDLWVFFPGGPGTAHALQCAKEANINTLKIEDPKWPYNPELDEPLSEA